MSDHSAEATQQVGSMNMQMALALAERGFRVFPCKAGSKEPATKNGFHDATTDPDQIRLWFSKQPNLNLAVATGPQPNGINLVAIDIDVHKGGGETWQEVKERLPECPRHETPHGGFHLFFNAPDDFRNTRDRLGPGIDTRGDGGYVVVPRSRVVDHKTGEVGYYSTSRQRALVVCPVPPMPIWLIDALRAKEPPLRGRQEPLPGPGPSGSVADDLRRRWDWDGELCRDGWSRGRQVGDGTYYTRPGKDPRDGHSAVLHESGAFVVFTTEAPPGLERCGVPTRDGVGFTVSPFQYFAWREHHGDLKAAARALLPERLDDAACVGVKTPPAPAPPTVPDEWWDQRPILRHIHDAAKAEMVHPEGLLIQALCRASALIPPCYKLPGVGGGGIGMGTLDLMGCIVAETGGGKSRTGNIARSLVVDPAHELPWEERLVLMDMPVGSGEGLIDAYYRTITEEDEDGKKTQVRRVARIGMFMTCDEGNAFISVQGRKGVTIVETMNSAWSGETLGQTNTGGDGGRFRLIPAGTVRFSAVLNMQASNAHKLFDEGLTVVGFPGRLLFAPAQDPEATLDGPPWPGPLALPRWPIFHTAQVLQYDSAIHREIKERILAQSRGEQDARRSQSIVGQCKVAAIFAMLDERTSISIADWSLAADVLARSSVFLATLEELRAQHLRADSHRRSELRGEMEAVAESAKERAQMGRTADRIMAILSEGPLPGSHISKRLSAQARPHRDGALEHLRSMGKVELDGERWKLL